VVIVIVGTQPVVRAALKRLLQIKCRLDEISEAGSAADLFAQVENGDVDLVLLDGHVPDITTIELIAYLKQMRVPPAVLVLDVRSESEQSALAAGADAFVVKGEHPKKLLIAIEKIRFRDE
jgi:two-component system nitrate/nitrite response regulator NarL